MAAGIKQAAQSGGALIVSDQLVPESDLAAMIQLDKTSQAVSHQLVEMGANEAAKALVIARGIKQFKSLLNDRLMADIMELMNTPLGFRTDKDPSRPTWNAEKKRYEEVKTYDRDTVREVVVQAFMRGLRVTGNEINIIAGNLYVTKEGFERLLAEMPGLTDLYIRLGVPQLQDGGALVPAEASWKFHGEPMSMEWQKGQVSDFRLAIRVNKAMGVDAIHGKAKSKVLRAIYWRVTGSKLALDEEAHESEAADVAVESTEVAS